MSTKKKEERKNETEELNKAPKDPAPNPESGAKKPCPSVSKAVPVLSIDGQKAVTVGKGKKNPDKIKIIAEIKEEGKDNQLDFDGKGKLEIVSNSDKIEVQDSSKNKLTLPLVLEGVKLKKKLEFLIIGLKVSGSKEDIELKYTLTKKGSVEVGTKASATVKITILNVLFSEDTSHTGGFDTFETIASEDQNGTAVTEAMDEEYSFLSIEKSTTGKVKYEIKGVGKEDIYFTSDDETVAKPKTEQPASASGTLEIEAQAKDKSETILCARYESNTGPVVAKLGIVVLKKMTYEAEFFRVKDGASGGTNLSLGSVTGAKLTTKAKQYYKQAISELKITGGGSEKNIDYDSNVKSTKNGALDLEPGQESEEAKLVLAGCASTKTRLVYVHELRWSYYLRANAAAGSNKIKIKNYGETYLGYIGTNQYKIENTDGTSETITVSAIDKTTGDITISGTLTNAFTTAKKSALIWPLGGLSGSPVWVSDVGSEDDLANYAAHELGHQLVDWVDLCEKDNVMFGGSTTGSKLRHRKLKQYYDTSKDQEQWKKMKGR